MRTGEAGRATLADFEGRCRSLGLAVTIQRRAVFEELSGRRDHPTADQVYETLHGRLPGLSRTTVYRVLETLVQAGLARKVQHADAVVRYDPMVERHHHLVCDACGRLVDVDDAAVPALTLPMARGAGFEIRAYTVSFTGLCTRCHRKKKER
jgi:Fur family peroxide stress response transcriptional regulator